MAQVPAEVRASYVVIIDDILAKSDLNTITSKRVRQGLQDAVEYDITPQKDEIKELIGERFEKVLAEKNSGPAVNGHDADHHHDKPKDASPSPSPKKGHKRKSESEVDGDTSEMYDSPPPKKKPRKPAVEDDAAFAARLQAEENSRARPTRTNQTRKSAPAKRKSPKKKTSSKVRVEDDSDVESSGREKKVNRSGGFHKPLNLSAPLSALLGGETQMSRPQAVKRIWEYVKDRDLQDPKDKRLIRCDDALRAVFKSEKVHMFTMNKILSQNLYDPEA